MTRKPQMPASPGSLRARMGQSALRHSAALAALLASGTIAFAQENPDTGEGIFELEAFVVSPVKDSLIEAQQIKRTSDPFVDSIVAQDIGKLPDNTVADALQRVPGVQVTRGAGEVNSVLIRGLPNLATTLNGEEIFTGVGRGVALQDLPADLISAVNVYKSRTAEQVEGGIAGLIDIQLRNPFDFDGQKTAGSLRLLQMDDADETNWVGSVMTSNRWELANGGQFGALFAASHQDIKYQDQTIYNFLWENRAATNDAGEPLVYPFNSGPIVHRGDRQRTAYNLNLQWEPSEGLQFYTNWLYTGYENKYQNYFFVGLPFTGAVRSYELYPGTDDVVSEVVSANHFLITSTQAYDDKTDGYNGVIGVRKEAGDTTWSSEFIYNYNKVVNQNLIMDIAKGGIPEFRMNFHPHFNATAPGADLSQPDGYGIWGLFDNNGYAEGESLVWRGDLERRLQSELFHKYKVGLRFSQRDVSSRQSNRADVAPASGRGVTPVSDIAGLGATAPDGNFGPDELALQNWFTPSADFLYSRPDEVRSLFGLPPGPAPFNDAVAFDDTETTYAAYGQIHYGTDIGEVPLDGQIGLRVVKSDVDLTGYDGNPIRESTSQTDFMPVVNGRLLITPKTQIRASFGRSITRPEFSDLNPVVNLTGPTTTGGAFGTGSGGNPSLEAVTSDNYDLSLERYYSEDSYFSLAGFYREIDGYVLSFSEPETIDGEQFSVSRPRNSGKSTLQGIETGVQHFFEALPGFGVQANYTYITGETDDPANNRTLDLANVSRNSFNVILIYEKNRFSSRLAYNWRDSYVESFGNTDGPGGPSGVVWVDATDRLDFSASYKLNEWATVSLDMTNILQDGRQDYFDYIGSPYPRDARLFDSTIELGFRFSL